MTMYNFHGTLPQEEIGKELRNIARTTKRDFKVLTGYGSQTGRCKSKEMVYKALRKMMKEGLIKAFLPAEAFPNILWTTDEFYEAKVGYSRRISKDHDARSGNEGITFVFVE